MKNTTVISQNKLERKDFRWNFTMGLVHGTLFTGGQAFGSPDTILPVFLNHFTSSKILVGLSSTLLGSFGGIGNVLLQLFVANRLETKVHKKPMLRAAITVRALCWGLLSLTTLLFAGSNPHLTVFFLFIFLLTFTVMGGVAAIPFFDIWGKALPSTIRGRFFGHRQFWGGILAVGSGFIAKAILGSRRIDFPENFSLLFFLAFIFMGISYLALGAVREPLQEVHKTSLPFKDFLKKAIQILKSNNNYRNFLAVQILGGAGALALPFYVLYAKDILHIELKMVGIFLMAQMIGSVVSNILWAYLSDFAGNKRVVQISTLLGIIPPLIVLISPHQFNELFILLFAVIGFFVAGRLIGKTNFLLDIAPPKERPLYLSVNGTLNIPVMLFPLLGGIIVQHISYTFLFIVTILVILVGLFLSFKLKEPRKGTNAGTTV
ncbi:MAG: MFS transporter [Desulfobacteraceae bacterium]|nr:MFS transporter [Desulfobacteraceae bacterium]